MKHKLLSRISLLLVFILVLGLMPMQALAASEEDAYVLTKVTHTAAIAPVNVVGSNVVSFKVPYSFSGTTVNLAYGLDIEYDANIYDKVVPIFPSGSTATIGGEPITMQVSYQKKGSTVWDSTNYRIQVLRDTSKAPAFSGTIDKALTHPGAISLKAADFTGKYTQNDGTALAYIGITGSNPSFGALKYNGNNYVFGEKISVSDLEAGRLTFSATAPGTVSYLVQAYPTGDTTNPIGLVSLKFTVTAPESKNMTVSVSTFKNEPVLLSDTTFKSAFSSAANGTLTTVRFSFPTNMHGKFYYNYRSSTSYDSVITSDTAYSVTLLPYIAFVPDKDYVGTVTIPFSGYNTESIGYTGQLVITISNLNANPISYTIQKDTPFSFKADDFNAMSMKLTGKALSDIQFALPPATQGKLYYNYVSAGKYDAVVPDGTMFYKDTAPYLASVDFVPASGYVGAVTIPYIAHDTSGNVFQGEVKFTVKSYDNTNPFPEYSDKYAWVLEALEYLLDNDLLTDSKFLFQRPSSSISKGDYIALLCEAFDLDTDDLGNFIRADDDDHDDDDDDDRRGNNQGQKNKNKPKNNKSWNNKWKNSLIAKNMRAALSRQDAAALLAAALD